MTQLFQSQYFTCYHSQKGRHFVFDFNQRMIRLSFCQLLALRQKVKKIDLEKHFSGENTHGLEIITICNREHIFIFNTLEIIDLKNFIQGTFGMLEVNSLVY